MGKKDKGADKPDASADLENLKADILELESTEISILTKSIYSIYNFIIKDRNENVNIVNELGVINELRRLVEHEDRLVKRYSLMTLAIISDLNLVRINFMNKKDDIISTLIRLTKEEDNVVVELALKILVSISSVSQLKEDLLHKNRLDELLACQNNSDPDIKKNLFEILLNLLCDLATYPIICQKSRELVTLALNNISCEYNVIQEKCLEMLHHIGFDQNALQVFIDMEGIDTLFVLVQNENYLSLHAKAYKVFEHIWKIEKHRKHFLENGHMEHIISTLTAQVENFKDNKAQSQPAKAPAKGKNKEPAAASPEEASPEEENLIAFCEVIYNTNLVINNPTLLDSLIKLLDQFEQTTNDNLKNNILKAIRVTAQSDSFREIILENGIPQKIFELLSIESIRSEAVMTLAQLVKEYQIRCLVISSGMCGVLVQMLDENEHDLSIGILSILITLGNGEEQFQSDALELGLASSLSYKFNSNVFTLHLLEIIRIYIQTPESIKTIMETQLLHDLVPNLKSPNTQVRIKTAELIRSLCINKTVFDYLIKADAIEILTSVEHSFHLRSRTSSDTLRYLLDFNLSFKFSFDPKAVLSQMNQINEGFYDCGFDQYEALELLNEIPINNNPPIIVIKMKPEDGTDDRPTDDHIITIQTSNEDIQSKKDKGKKGKNKKGKKGGEAPEAAKATPTAGLGVPREKSIHTGLDVRMSKCEMSRRASNTLINRLPGMLFDSAESLLAADSIDTELFDFLDKMADLLEGKLTLAQQLKLIGSEVADRFGGNDLNLYENELMELKRQRNSNVILLGSIKIGMYRERALLFKLVCDINSIPVTLNRGDYDKVWNCFYMNDGEYLVDLIKNPGSIHHINSEYAQKYISYGFFQ